MRVAYVNYEVRTAEDGYKFTATVRHEPDMSEGDLSKDDRLEALRSDFETDLDATFPGVQVEVHSEGANLYKDATQAYVTFVLPAESVKEQIDAHYGEPSKSRKAGRVLAARNVEQAVKYSDDQERDDHGRFAGAGGGGGGDAAAGTDRDPSGGADEGSTAGAASSERAAEINNEIERNVAEADKIDSIRDEELSVAQASLGMASSQLDDVQRAFREGDLDRIDVALDLAEEVMNEAIGDVRALAEASRDVGETAGTGARLEAYAIPWLESFAEDEDQNGSLADLRAVVAEHRANEGLPEDERTSDHGSLDLAASRMEAYGGVENWLSDDRQIGSLASTEEEFGRRQQQLTDERNELQTELTGEQHGYEKGRKAGRVLAQRNVERITAAVEALAAALSEMGVRIEVRTATEPAAPNGLPDEVKAGSKETSPTSDEVERLRRRLEVDIAELEID